MLPMDDSSLFYTGFFRMSSGYNSETVCPNHMDSIEFQSPPNTERGATWNCCSGAGIRWKDIMRNPVLQHVYVLRTSHAVGVCIEISESDDFAIFRSFSAISRDEIQNFLVDSVEVMNNSLTVPLIMTCNFVDFHW